MSPLSYIPMHDGDDVRIAMVFIPRRADELPDDLPPYAMWKEADENDMVFGIDLRTVAHLAMILKKEGLNPKEVGAMFTDMENFRHYGEGVLKAMVDDIRTLSLMHSGVQRALDGIISKATKPLGES